MDYKGTDKYIINALRCGYNNDKYFEKISIYVVWGYSCAEAFQSWRNGDRKTLESYSKNYDFEIDSDIKKYESDKKIYLNMPNDIEKCRICCGYDLFFEVFKDTKKARSILKEIFENLYEKEKTLCECCINGNKNCLSKGLTTLCGYTPKKWYENDK